MERRTLTAELASSAGRSTLSGSRRSQFAIDYTQEQVDAAVAVLEKHSKKLNQTTTKTKGQAVERDLLAAAGDARMYLVAAYAGEKDKLNEVFGGNCERVGRLNHVLDSTVFRTDESKRDARWGDMRKSL